MNEITFIKKFELNTPSWDELLSNLNYTYLDKGINNEYIKHIPPSFFACREAYQILKVQHVLKKLHLTKAHSYISIFQNSKTFGEHIDEVDVWFWQVKGKNKWIIEKQKEYILEEGDLIYIPKKTIHEVIPLEPRAGISMSK